MKIAKIDTVPYTKIVKIDTVPYTKIVKIDTLPDGTSPYPKYIPGESEKTWGVWRTVTSNLAI